jgi:hypothetical protein
MSPNAFSFLADRGPAAVAAAPHQQAWNATPSVAAHGVTGHHRPFVPPPQQPQPQSNPQQQQHQWRPSNATPSAAVPSTTFGPNRVIPSAFPSATATTPTGSRPGFPSAAGVNPPMPAVAANGSANLARSNMYGPPAPTASFVPPSTAVASAAGAPSNQFMVAHPTVAADERATA